ncbi:unnamed protein product [Protopolystoma xenopodis]|uniref:Uncharacterized protein n=1 Tax=Protopolystoma xenopodis TaxID=117903 RepID=A0A3S5B993_9PLAT|nr:unnamed protein product [Protopolystoma xenopodis]
MKGVLVLFLSDLAASTRLRCLDISGNGLGDAGARMLARVLVSTETLQVVAFDSNGLSLQVPGFHIFRFIFDSCFCVLLLS